MNCIIIQKSKYHREWFCYTPLTYLPISSIYQECICGRWIMIFSRKFYLFCTYTSKWGNIHIGMFAVWQMLYYDLDLASRAEPLTWHRGRRTGPLTLHWCEEPAVRRGCQFTVTQRVPPVAGDTGLGVSWKTSLQQRGAVTGVAVMLLELLWRFIHTEQHYI